MALPRCSDHGPGLYCTRCCKSIKGKRRFLSNRITILYIYIKEWNALLGTACTHSSVLIEPDCAQKSKKISSFSIIFKVTEIGFLPHQNNAKLFQAFSWAWIGFEKEILLLGVWYRFCFKVWNTQMLVLWFQAAFVISSSGQKRDLKRGPRSSSLECLCLCLHPTTYLYKSVSTKTLI